MAYIKPSAVDTLSLPTDPAFTVVMKRRASFGDVEAARNAMVTLDTQLDSKQEAKVDAKVEYANYLRELLPRLIVSWNLTDEEDQPLPVNAKSMERLDPIDGDFLSKEAQKRSSLRPQVQEVPFEKQSGASSPNTP